MDRHTRNPTVSLPVSAAEPSLDFLVLPGKLIEPKRDQILRFCEEDPVERVFLEDVARRGLGRFVGVVEGRELRALCHVGVNAVPSGRGCGADRKSTRLNSSHIQKSRMPSSA